MTVTQDQKIEKIRSKMVSIDLALKEILPGDNGFTAHQEYRIQALHRRFEKLSLDLDAAEDREGRAKTDFKGIKKPRNYSDEYIQAGCERVLDYNSETSRYHFCSVWIYGSLFEVRDMERLIKFLKECVAYRKTFP